VENLVLVELKSSKQLIDKDEARLLNYLKATKCEVSPLLNFGTKPEIKRKAFDNYR
jgi:GxxExxY protein